MLTDIHQWHRKIGITAAAFVIILVISGLLLNHTTQLQLHNIQINSPLLLQWYDINPKDTSKSFSANQQWLTLIGQRLYFNQTEIADQINDLLGVVGNHEYLFVAIDNALLILTMQGQIVEKISPEHGLPQDMQAIGLSATGDIIIITAHGNLLTDPEITSWKPHNLMPTHRSTIADPPKALYNQLLNSYRGQGISLEKVILDIHSGRILGWLGVMLVDFMACLFLLLSISGMWMWYKYR